MVDLFSARRMAENEVFFRQQNERIQEGFDQLNELAEDAGQSNYRLDDGTVLRFYCECSDENCRDRISLTLEDYTNAHKTRDTFTIKCGHEVTNIEHIITKKDNYCIVRKYLIPPESVSELHPTPINKS